MSRYRTIVADPPWPMHWNGGGQVRRKGDGTVYANANAGAYGLPYRTMSIDEIVELPIADLADDNSAHLYVELFARRARFGWDYWGDQSLGTASMEAA